MGDIEPRSYCGREVKLQKIAGTEILKNIRKTIKNADEFLNERAEAMKTRAECLEEYGSDTRYK